MSKACSPDAHCTDIQNMKKMFHLVLQKHAAPSPPPPPSWLPCLMHFAGPATTSRLKKQHMVVLQTHERPRSKSTRSLQTEPRVGRCYRQDPFTSPRPSRSTSNVLGISRSSCSTSVSLSLSATAPPPPFIFFTISCALFSTSSPASLSPPLFTRVRAS